MGAGSGTTDAVVVLDFGGDKTATSGTFTIQPKRFTTSHDIKNIRILEEPPWRIKLIQ